MVSLQDFLSIYIFNPWSFKFRAFSVWCVTKKYQVDYSPTHIAGVRGNYMLLNYPDSSTYIDHLNGLCILPRLNLLCNE